MESGSAKASSVAESSRRVDLFFAGLAVLLSAVALFHFHAKLQQLNLDISYYYIPWYEHVLHARFGALEGGYANYSPPYLYILSFTSLFNRVGSPTVMVKLAQIPGLIAGAFLFWSICRKLGCSHTRSLLAAWMLLVAPEVVQNTIVWGQCDMLHTACLLGMLRLLLARRPGWAMACLGVALAFKLQAIFVGAVVAALFLSTEIPLWTALCIPAAYVVMMIPARLAGRPWIELLLIYAGQFNSQPDLAKDVANPYQLLYHFSETHSQAYWLLLHGGMLVAGVATVALIYFLTRSPWRLRGQSLLLAASFTLLMETYLLPKMHDRYFFAGDTILLLAAMMRPKLIVPVALLQISAIVTAYPHLVENGADERARYYILPVLMTTVAVVWVGKLLLSERETPAAV